METHRITKTNNGWRLDVFGVDGPIFVGVFDRKREAKAALANYYFQFWKD